MNYSKIDKAIFLTLSFIILAGIVAVNHSCGSAKSSHMIIPADTLLTNMQEKGPEIEFHFLKGETHNHPLMALWIEDTSGNYLQTMYIAESIAKGVYGHGDKSTGKWLPGPIRRPASLPVWAHSRGFREKDGYYIPSVENPLPDAVTGATPPGDFVVVSRLSQTIPPVFDICFEINQSWDWNEYWTNNKYPEDENYKTSCQPALVYKARVNLTIPGNPVELTLTGHSHYSGMDGEIYKDLSTITTAKNITKKVWLKIIRSDE